MSNSTAIICLLILSAAVASAAPEPVPTLPSGYGYLVLDTDIGRSASDWRIGRRTTIQELPQGQHLRLIPLKAGHYQSLSISLPHYNLPSIVDLSSRPQWSFTIQTAKLNYIGSIIVGKKRSRSSVDLRLRNRATAAYERLLEQYPDLLGQYEFVYSGYLEDDFTRYLPKPDTLTD